jgi:hypothetical protein
LIRIVLYCIVAGMRFDVSLLFFPNSLNIGKSIDPDGKKIGEGKDKEAAFDDEYYARFTSLYDHHGRSPPTQEGLKKFIGVEENLFYLVNNILENRPSLLDGDFIDQVMSQYEGQPEVMMEFVEEYILDANRAEMISIDPPPIDSPPASPHLQIAGPAVIENGTDDMDITTGAKRPRQSSQSKANVLEIGN